jgi:hypothetical protein
MKSIAHPRSAAAAATGGALQRRGLIVGAGAVGVAAIAAHSLRGRTVEAVAVETAKPQARSAGYRATPHVLRYYETAKS